MEWTIRQQICFLLQSVCLGAMEGVCLDAITALIPSQKKRDCFWIDIAFGPFAAVVSFFGALVIMDGQLHPLLLFGVFFGMWIEHIFIGIFLHKVVRKIRKYRSEIRVFLNPVSACLKNIRFQKEKFFKKVEKQ